MDRRSVVSVALVLMLSLSGSMGFRAQGEAGVSRAGPIYMADVHINVTLPNGSAAPYAYVYLHHCTSPYDSVYVHDKTDAYGKLLLKAGHQQIGPCYVSVMNLTRTAFVREELFIEPGGVHYIDMVLTDGLPFDYTITGVVRNQSTDLPVDKARVTINGFDARGRDIFILNETGSDGRYSFALPYSDRPYSMTATYPYGPSNTYMSDLYLDPVVHSYTEDIYLRAIPGSEWLSVHLMNGTTWAPLANEWLVLSGFQTFDDHRSLWRSNTTNSDGWANFSAGRGEYSLQLSNSIFHPTALIYGSFATGIVMNDTPTSLTIDLPIPSEWRNVTFNITDAVTGDPMDYVYVGTHVKLKDRPGYDLDLDIVAGTDTSGEAVLPLPPNMDVDVNVYKDSMWEHYDTKEIKVRAGPVDDDPYIRTSLRLLSTGYGDPMGNLSVLVLDEKTGIRIPLANVYAVRNDNSGVSSFGTTTDIHGYANWSFGTGTYLVKADTPLGTGSVSGVEVREDRNTSITLYITERKDYPEEPYHYTFNVIDETGNDVPYMGLELLRYENGSVITYQAQADEDGLVRVTCLPGEYLVSASSPSKKTQTRTHHYLPFNEEMTLPDSGGTLDDLVVYSTEPLEEITGYIKDASNGEPIQGAYVETNSFTSTASGTRDLIGPGQGTIYDVGLYYQASRTMTSGYYRTWGNDYVSLYVTADGYFPETGSLTPGLRSIIQDFYLEPLLPMSTFVNGTLVDENGAPIEGYVGLLDLDRNGYRAAYCYPGSDGNLSIPIYPGRFQVEYGNGTERETTEIVVPEGGTHFLILAIVPESRISGKVTDRRGTLLLDINVTLYSGDIEEAFVLSDTDGYYSFEAPAGNYRVVVQRTDLYEGFRSGSLHIDGFRDLPLDIVLENRTVGDILCNVMGNLPGMEGPVPNATVHLNDGGNATIGRTATSADGTFSFLEVEYGIPLNIYVEPPEDLSPDESTYRSGYLTLLFGPFNISSPMNTFDLTLEFVDFDPPGYYNITSYAPTGTDVPLNEPIVIVFSTGMNTSAIDRLFSIQPRVRGLDYEWSKGNTTLTVYHQDFDINTTYIMTLSRNLLSEEGYRTWTDGDLEWNFTTGETVIAWRLDSAEVSVDADGTVSVSANGVRGMQLFMVIDGVGSFEVTERRPGTYSATIAPGLFEWERTYSYHFSNVTNGTDLAPSLAGTFTTPPEPVVLEITSADVTIDEDGNWHVSVEGTPGMTLYIVIDGVGSFPLEETSPGVYEAVIDADNFEWERDYPYHFSTTPGGAPIPGWGPFSGAETMPSEPEDVSDTWCWFAGCCTLTMFVIVILLIIIIVFALARKKGEGAEE